MRFWGQLAFSITMLAPAAHAAEMKLEIAPPEPDWLLPVASEPCGSGGGRVEGCTTQLQPEGIATVGERSLVLDLEPLLVSRDYEAVLARVGVDYGPELRLLEAGDAEGFLRTRMPTDGSPPPLPANVFVRRRVNDPRPDTISAGVLYVIGQSYFSLGRYLPAEMAFGLALRALPDHVRAHESLGLLYLRTGRYADARVQLAQAVQLGRNTATVHTALGYLEQQTRHYWAAANAFQRALELEPDNRSAQRGLLHALTETHEHAKARALVERLLEAEPDDSDLWLYRAQLALAAEERSVALASLETALRLGDDSAANRASCAALQIESGSIARAVDLMRGAGTPGLSFRLVDRVLGWLANENDWDDYRELFGTVDGTARGVVEQSRLLTRRASLALHDGDRRAARTALQDALALDPSNADALMALARLYRAQADLGRADLLLQRASDYAAVRGDALVARAGVAVAQEHFDDALELLRGAVTADPARSDLRRNIEVLEQIALLRSER